jgi:hypothetical protein
MVRVVTLGTFLTSSSSRTLLQHHRAIEGEVEEAFALEEPQGLYLLVKATATSLVILLHLSPYLLTLA